MLARTCASAKITLFPFPIDRPQPNFATAGFPAPAPRLIILGSNITSVEPTTLERGPVSGDERLRASRLQVTHPGDTFDDLRRRARFEKHSEELLRDWLAMVDISEHSAETRSI